MMHIYSFSIYRKTFDVWITNKGPHMAAALAFYTFLSLAPLLIVVLAVSGYLIDQSLTQAHLLAELRQFLGPSGAEAIAAILQASRNPSTGRWASAASLVTLLFGATGVLVELQDGLNKIWKVPEESGFYVQFRRRLHSFALLLSISFLFLVSLVISTCISALAVLLSDWLPLNQTLWEGLDFFLSLTFIGGVFALIFKILPRVDIQWGDVWKGAAVTSVLFALGKFLVGFYIGRTAVLSSYGAAGSLVVLLIWVYYSALILYFGAALTKVSADQLKPHAKAH